VILPWARDAVIVAVPLRPFTFTLEVMRMVVGPEAGKVYFRVEVPVVG